MSAPTYHAVGSVRGPCGHHHRSIATAVACALRDSRACRSLGGGCYSDRTVQRTDGVPLTAPERTQIEDAYYYAEDGCR